VGKAGNKEGVSFMEKEHNLDPLNHPNCYFWPGFDGTKKTLDQKPINTGIGP